MKEKQNKQKNLKHGFTLLELLVVVLIIGILAAIALPQYKMATGKTKLSELKTITRTLNEAASIYFLTHGAYTDKLNNLDVQIPQGDISCAVYLSDNNVSCSRNIFGVTIAYYVKKQSNKPVFCYVIGSSSQKHPANILCAQDTNSTNPTCWESNCMYFY